MFYIGNSMATSNIWTGWCDQTATTSTQAIWTNWQVQSWTNIQRAQTHTVYDPWPSWAGSAYNSGQRLPTEAEARHQREEVVRIQAEAEAARRRRKAAEERAEQLFLSYLTPEQARDYGKHKAIVVCAKHGTSYRIRCGASMVGNVERLDDKGEVVARLCAHDRVHGTPAPDQWLAQMLYLRHHEDEFLRIANRH